MSGNLWSAGAGVELIKVVLGGFVGVKRLVQVVLTGKDRDTINSQ